MCTDRFDLTDPKFEDRASNEIHLVMHKLDGLVDDFNHYLERRDLLKPYKEDYFK